MELTIPFLAALRLVPQAVLNAADTTKPAGKPNVIQLDDQRMTDETGARRDGLLRSYLANPPSLTAKTPIWSYTNFALAAYWFQGRMPEADRAMIGPTAAFPVIVTAATTFYRPSPVVADLVKDVAGRRTYAYISGRPGLGKSFNEKQSDGFRFTVFGKNRFTLGDR